MVVIFIDNSATNTIKNLLGDNAEDKIKAALGTLSGMSNSQPEQTNEDTQINLPAAPVMNDMTADSIMQIKSIVENITNSTNDSRANLLMSLKPYMRTSRQGSIDTAIRILNLTKLGGIFKLR